MAANAERDDRPEAKRVFDNFSALAERLSAVVNGKGFADFLTRAHDALQKAPLHDAAIEKIHTLETRLEKAMQRADEEAGKNAVKFAELMNENRELKSSLTVAEAAIAAMSDHPDVKARVKADLKKRAALLSAELAKHGCNVHIVDVAEMKKEAEEKAPRMNTEDTDKKED